MPFLFSIICIKSCILFGNVKDLISFQFSKNPFIYWQTPNLILWCWQSVNSKYFKTSYHPIFCKPNKYLLANIRYLGLPVSRDLGRKSSFFTAGWIGIITYEWWRKIRKKTQHVLIQQNISMLREYFRVSPRLSPHSVTDEPRLEIKQMLINLTNLSIFGRLLNMIFMSLKYKSSLYTLVIPFRYPSRFFFFSFSIISIAKRD